MQPMLKNNNVGEPELKVLDGPGTGTSDSIHTALPENGFVITAAAMEFFGPDFFKRLVDAVPADPAGEEMGEEHMEVHVSDGEGYIPPEVVEFYGPEFFDKILAAAGGDTNTPPESAPMTAVGEESMEGEEPEGFKKGGKVGCYAVGGHLKDEEARNGPLTQLQPNPVAPAPAVGPTQDSLTSQASTDRNVMARQAGYGSQVDDLASGKGIGERTNAIVQNGVNDFSNKALQSAAPAVGAIAQGSENLMRGTGDLIDTAGKGFSKIGEMLNPVSAAEGIAKNVGNIIGGSDNIKELNAQPEVGRFKSNLEAAGSAALEGAKERATVGNGLVGLLTAPVNAAQKGIQAFSDNDQYQKLMAAEAARNDPNSPSYKYEPENQGVLQDVVKQRQAQAGTNPQQTQAQPETSKKPAVGSGIKESSQSVGVGQTTASVGKTQSAVQQTPPAEKGIATRALNQVASDNQVGQVNRPWPTNPQFPGDDRANTSPTLPNGIEKEYSVTTNTPASPQEQQLADNVVNLSGNANWNAPNPNAGKPGRKVIVDPWYTEQDKMASAYGAGQGAQYEAAKAAQMNAKTEAQQVGYDNANKQAELQLREQGKYGRRPEVGEASDEVWGTDQATGEPTVYNKSEIRKKNAVKQRQSLLSIDPTKADFNNPDDVGILRSLSTNKEYLASPEGEKFTQWLRQQKQQG